MMELKEALEALKPFADALTDYGDDPAENGKADCWEHPVAGCVTLDHFRRAAKAYEALSRLSLEGGGEKASCTDSTDAPACGAATSAVCQSELEPLPKQVADQLRVVANLATSLAEVNTDLAGLIESGASLPLAVVGPRSARQMEVLGDILNGMDAAEDDDAWMAPVFAEAQRLFPAESGAEGSERSDEGTLPPDDQQSQATERLREALKAARVAVESWGAYADPYFQEKWDLKGDLSAIDAALSVTEPSAEGGVS